MKVSLFGVPKLSRLAPPLVANDNGLKIASLLDLAGTKASVLQVRAEAKDYMPSVEDFKLRKDSERDLGL